MKRISNSIIICIVILLINIAILISGLSKIPKKPDEMFIENMDRLFTGAGNVEISRSDGTAIVTEEFKTLFQRAYENHDYQRMYDVCKDNYLSISIYNE